MRSPEARPPELVESEPLVGTFQLEVRAALRLLAHDPRFLHGGPVLMPVQFRFGPLGDGREILVPVECVATPRVTDDGR